jgi:transglutaminase-like putative cysteine protease
MRRLLNNMGLAARIWLIYLRVTALLQRLPLHDVVKVLGRGTPHPGSPDLAPRYSRAIHRILRFGQRRPRCLPSALVLFRLLRAKNLPAELVIGLPSSPITHTAHAWVELNGRDVGPPPGRQTHEVFARYE